MAAIRPLFVVAGVGNASGTGAAAARLFSGAGYSVALIARSKDSLEKLAGEINDSGGNAAAFPIPSYGATDITAAFSSIRTHFPSSQFSLRAALFNAGHGVWKPFLDITPEDIQETLNTNVVAGFAFARESILNFKQNDIDSEKGKRGTLIFTGATASLRGNVTTSAFAAAKFGTRALSQSLAKEFGKDSIHVAHAIIDGGILTGNATSRLGPHAVGLSPESIAQSYLYLVNQDKSAWTWELDLRPSHEKW